MEAKTSKQRPAAGKEGSSLSAQLLAAVKQNNLEETGFLLENGASADARDQRTGLSALMIAAGLGSAALTTMLIAHGADVFRTDEQAGATALHKSCQSGSLETVRILVEAGSLLNQQTAITGHTPLIDAIWYQSVEIVAYLLSLDTALNLRTSYGFTLTDHVNYALKTSSRGSEKMLAIQGLIQKRQERDQMKVDSRKLTAAVLANDIQGVRQAIGNGADLEEKVPIRNSFDDGYTPLLIAARDGHVEIVKELLKAGANPNATDAIFLAVPLHKATYHGHLAVTEVLAAHPGVNLDFQGATNGYTPLHDALWHGYSYCAKVLIAAGAQLTIRAHDGTNALDIAAKVFGTDHEMVRFIREKMEK